MPLHIAIMLAHDGKNCKKKMYFSMIDAVLIQCYDKITEKRQVIYMEYATITKNLVNSLIPDRNVNSHKGDYGKIFLLCGSVGYTGAPALAAMGALRSGAGLVYLGVPESIYSIEAAKLLEPIVVPLKDQNGMLSHESICKIKEMTMHMDAVLLGPGLGKSEGTRSVVHWILDNFEGPVVVDADGINVLIPHKDVLRGRTSPTILTPHEGEFQRLGGNLCDGRIAGAVKLAQDLNVIVVLKGHNTIITDGTDCYLNPTGNPGMAVGGSGDVLAGMLVSLLGQKLVPVDAAVCAVWLHGAAGDICAEEIGQYGMLPSDILDVLPRLLK